MSDSDEYSIHEDSEEYDFEYSDDGQSDAGSDVDAENAYYNAKSLKEDSLSDAATAFTKVVSDESSSGSRTQWGFKCLKQLIKIDQARSSAPSMLEHYKALLEYISSSSVTQNVSEKAINGILDRLSKSGGDSELLNKVYGETLAVFSLPSTSNPRLWHKCSLKLGQLLLDTNDIPRLKGVIDDLLAKDEESMEVYALQIQMYQAQRLHSKLKEVYKKATAVRDNVPHPRTLAIIQECGGKTWMSESNYAEAATAFFVSFKGFDEAGDNSRLRVLRYLLLASMLSEATINPLDSPECRPYRDSPSIAAMTKLVNAFHDGDVKGFERVALRNEGGVADDDFVKGYMSELLRTVRAQVLARVLRPFDRVSLAYLSEELNGVGEEEVESLLVGLIVEGR